jgi:hypothetical protein
MREVNVFTVVCGGLLLFFIVGTVLLGLFSKRSALEILDWRPAEKLEVPEEDDVAQMIEAQNEIRARLGKPPRTRDEVERWRES